MSHRFRVKRTSVWNDDVPPCPEAVRGTYTQHVYCTLPLKEAMRSERTDWFRRLTNQRSAPGGSVGDRENQPCWFVEFDNLDQLLAFAHEHGDLVLKRESDGSSIEIYDDYRE